MWARCKNTSRVKLGKSNATNGEVAKNATANAPRRTSASRARDLPVPGLIPIATRRGTSAIAPGYLVDVASPANAPPTIDLVTLRFSASPTAQRQANVVKKT